MIVITDPTFFVDESKYINALFDNGLDVLHIRKPDATVDEMRKLIQQIKVQYHYNFLEISQVIHQTTPSFPW